MASLDQIFGVFPGAPLQFSRQEKTSAVVLPGSLCPVSMRSRLSKQGLEQIRLAAQVTDEALARARRLIKPGMTELELAKIIRDYFVEKGFDESFDTIAVSGPNTANIHGVPGMRTIQPNDIIMIDIGARYQGPGGPWCSDLTRTFFVGKPTAKQTEIWTIVREAQIRALKAVKPGASAAEVDKAARDYVESRGYDIPHGVGHGVGHEIHEPPIIYPGETYRLKVGDVITVEPGVYLGGEGFGVRIEDLVVVTETGFELLTHSSYDRAR